MARHIARHSAIHTATHTATIHTGSLAGASLNTHLLEFRGTTEFLFVLAISTGNLESHYPSAAATHTATHTARHTATHTATHTT